MQNVSETTAWKLDPQRFPGMSPRMAAIVGCILGRQCTHPAIAELVTTADGYVLARRDGDIGFNDLIGSRSDLERNWRRLLDAAGLTDHERQLAERKYHQHITTF